MGLDVKDLSTSAQKWSNRASGAASEFAERAQGAAELWGRNTAAAQDNYRQAVTAGNIAARFARGVQKAAASGKFARKLAAVGAGRYSEGVGVAQADWSAGFEPYHGVLRTITLPSRAPRGDVRNYERVKTIGTALNAKRLAGLGGGA